MMNNYQLIYTVLMLIMSAVTFNQINLFVTKNELSFGNRTVTPLGKSILIMC